MPPTINLFAFDESTYSTAFLYVPIGCEEAYRAAAGWDSFTHLREEDFSTKDFLLTLKGMNGGSVALKFKTGSTYAFQIMAETGWKVSSVSFNGKDVTANVATDGTYTTPSLTDDSELSIVFEQDGSALKEVEADGGLRVRASGSVLYIDNEGRAVQAGIYTTDGKQVKHLEAANGTTSVSLQTGNVYLVKIGERTFKVAI